MGVGVEKIKSCFRHKRKMNVAETEKGRGGVYKQKKRRVSTSGESNKKIQGGWGGGWGG